MTQSILKDTHPADSEILRFHDGECGVAEAERVAEHIAACPRCGETYGLFHTATRHLQAALEEMPIQPVPQAKERLLSAALRQRRARPFGGLSRPQSPLLRAAIVIFGLFIVSMWAPPVRAWVFRLFHIDQPANVATAPVPQRDEPLSTPSSSTVSFVPASPTFVIDVATAQLDGRLTIRVIQSARASARITGGSPDDALLVMDDGVRIQNSRESSALFTVLVPSSVVTITLRMAGAEARSYSTQEIARQDSVVVTLQ